MFSQGTTNSPYRFNGFGTPHQGQPVAQPYNAASSSSAFSGYGSTAARADTFAGPQFGGGNHGAAGGFGGFGASAGPGVGVGGGQGYGSPFGGQGALQSSTGGAAGTPGAKRNYLPGYLSSGAAAQVSSPFLSLSLSLSPPILRQKLTACSVPCSRPSRRLLKLPLTTARGTRPRGGRPSRARP